MDKITVPSEISTSIIALIKGSTFYNKIQISFNSTESEKNTETFYFSENKWAHSIFKEKTDGTSEVTQATQIVTEDQKIIDRFGALEGDAKVIIAGNSSDFILSMKL